MQSIIQPKRPSKSSRWLYGGLSPDVGKLGYEGHYWGYPEQGLRVISAVEKAIDPNNDLDIGPEYHISISKNGGRCSRNEAKAVLKAFDMSDATEGNHIPNGFVRNFWMPVAENLTGHVCPCTDRQPAMKEDKGEFVWRGV